MFTNKNQMSAGNLLYSFTNKCLQLIKIIPGNETDFCDTHFEISQIIKFLNSHACQVVELLNEIFIETLFSMNCLSNYKLLSFLK
jgi:hypothetical protein